MIMIIHKTISITKEGIFEESLVHLLEKYPLVII